MAINRSNSFDTDNKIKDITFVDIFSEEYKDKYLINNLFDELSIIRFLT